VSVLSTARAGVFRHGEITRQMLRAGRRGLVIWSAAFAAMIAVYAVIWPSVRGNARWRDLFDTLPQAYRALFTASGTVDLSTPAGYLGIELMGFIGPALIAMYAIGAGSAALAGEEDRGGLEITLSAPVSRVQVLAQRLTGLVIGVAALAATTGIALWVFSAALGMDLRLGAIASAAAALGIFGLFAGAVALAVGGITGSTAAARGAGALVAVASYLINALAQITTSLRHIRPISPYYLVLGNEPLSHGLRLVGAVSVLAAAAVLVAAGCLVFTRRDLRG
jgi:beta-exotoxin I transport system permease protein